MQRAGKKCKKRAKRKMQKIGKIVKKKQPKTKKKLHLKNYGGAAASEKTYIYMREAHVPKTNITAIGGE